MIIKVRNKYHSQLCNGTACEIQFNDQIMSISNTMITHLEFRNPLIPPSRPQDEAAQN